MFQSISATAVARPVGTYGLVARTLWSRRPVKGSVSLLSLHRESANCQYRSSSVNRLSFRSCAFVARSEAAKNSEDAKRSSDSPSTSSSTSEGTDNEKKKKDDEKTGWGTFAGYAAMWFSGLTFFYYFYTEDYNLHRTEVAIVNAVRRLPLYYPQGRSDAETNAKLDGDGLPPELVQAFAEWFVAEDLKQKEGIVRNDVLELLVEMGFDETSKHCQRYLDKGEGMLQERKRWSGTGLQESLSLLADLALRPPQPPKPGLFGGKVEEPTEPPVDPKTLIGPAAVELLRKKVRGAPPMSAHAQALRQLTQPQVVAPQSAQPNTGDSSVQSSPFPAAATLAPIADDDDVDDDAAQVQLEAARLRRLENELMSRLESRGSLSAGEEGRLRDVRDQLAALKL